jgi:integrase/recombinase XerD
MLAVYKRHSGDCPHRARSYRRCDCPCWAEGTVEGKYYRESLKTRSWTRATEIVREREDHGGTQTRRITIQNASDQFISDAEARGLRKPSIYKYKLLLKQLGKFADDEGLRFISECDIESLRRFRESWPNQNFSARKKLEAMRTFFKFVHESGWLPTNPAKLIKSPKTENVPTMPYSKEEFARVLAACDKHPDCQNAIRLRALTLLLRYSGLRITDAVTLPKRSIKGDVLVLRTAKTGTEVRVPLPPIAIEALAAIKTDGNYFFWSGHGTKKSRVSNFERMYKTVYEIANIENGHAHRWRDTFSVELLLSGTPLERLSILLGHQSVKVTERHYSPWVSARQKQLEDDVRKSWT